MSKELLVLQQQLVPDLLQVMKKRYRILHHLFLTQPIGRRALAQQLQTTERILRAEVDFLKEQNLLQVETVGMNLTEQGETLLEALADVMREVEGVAEKERNLAEKLHLQEVRIVSGNADTDPLVKKSLGHAAADLLKRICKAGDTIAVTGGTTIASIAEAMPRTNLSVQVVPARGGIGENMENQANTIASKLAAKLGGTYRLLHAPDMLNDAALQSFLSDPQVLETLQSIRQARIVVHGIGQAIPMAKRRRLPESTMEQLKMHGATAEAFGYYFDSKGNIVHAMNTVGLRMSDLHNSERVIAVAGGASKAAAIASVARGCPLHVLITDEAVADAILADTETFHDKRGGENHGN